jgi:hypothetical protein
MGAKFGLDSIMENSSYIAIWCDISTGTEAKIYALRYK